MVKIDIELDAMQQAIVKMGGKVVAMHEKIITVLQNPDKELELEIVQSDERINLLEEEINDIAISSLALLSPVASDLRKVIAGIKIASELERIGDYAKNVAAFLIKRKAPEAYVLQYAEMMEKHLIEMLELSMECYINRDVETAFELPSRDKEINKLLKELKQNVNKHYSKDSLDAIFDISSMLRNIERAGDHTKNICEHIIYMVKGQHYDFG